MCTDTRIGSSQFDGRNWKLGYYELEKDAARSFDKVASILGRRPIFSKGWTFVGERSKGADERVAEVVNAAKAFMTGD